MPITTGTNTAETWSTRRCTGAFEPWASCTSFTICASAVSLPMRVARNWKLPVRLSVAPITRIADALLHGHALAGQHALVKC